MKSKKEIISDDFLQSLAIVVTISGGVAGGLTLIGLHPYICFAIFITPILYLLTVHLLEKTDKNKKDLPAEIQSVTQSTQDWGNAPDVPVFFGRTQELVTLEQWIV